MSWRIDLQKDGSGTSTGTFITSPLYAMALREALKKDAAKTGMTFRESIRDGKHHMAAIFAFNSLSTLEQRINSFGSGDTTNRFTVKTSRTGDRLVEHSIRVGKAKRDQALAFIGALVFRGKMFRYELGAPTGTVDPNPARLGDLEIDPSQNDNGAVWTIPMETLLAQGYESLLVSFMTSLNLGSSNATSDQSLSGPSMPYEDHGACPFECCTYRRWLANEDTRIRMDREENAPVSFNVRKGEWVSATTGVVITTKPGQAKILRPITVGGIPAEIGDYVYLLTNQGEGFYKVWYKGEEWEPGTNVDGNINVLESLRTIQAPASTWWVQIKNNKGQVGWSKEPNNFDNRDACGENVVEVEECDKNALMSALNNPASNKITLFVDGIALKPFIDFINVLWRGPWPSKEVNYLCKSPLANVLKLKIPSVHGAIFWNGDLEDDVAVEGAVAELQTSILQLTRAGKQIDLITHSFGSVISYVALARIAEKSYARPIANLVTLASPLGHEKVLPWIGKNYPALNIPKAGKILPPGNLNIRGEWINAYAEEDLIGGRINIPKVINISESVPDAKPWAVQDSFNHRLEAHSAPYSNPSIYKRVIDHLKASYSSASGQVRNDLPLKSETKYKNAASTTNSKAKKEIPTGCNKESSTLELNTGRAQGVLKKYGVGKDGC